MMLEIATILQAVVFGLLNAGIYALAAAGLVLMFSMLNIINFAHGDFLMLGMYVTYFLASSLTIGPITTAIFSIPLFFALGAAVYLGALHKIVRATPLSQLAVTVALLVLLRNFALSAWGGEPKALSFGVLQGLTTLGPVVLPLSRLVAALASIGALVALEVFLKKTHFGISIRAAADDQEATALMGVNTKMLFTVTVGIGMALTAFAASLIMTFQQVNPLSGLLYGLLTWVLIALAGTGRIKEVIVAAVILAVAESLGMFFWDPRARNLVVYGIFVLVLMVKPTGLFGRKS